MTKGPGGTASSLSGSGGPSNIRRFARKPTPAFQRPAAASVAIWVFATADGPIQRRAGKPQTKPASIVRCPIQRQRKPGAHPLKMRPGPVQTNQTTFGCWERTAGASGLGGSASCPATRIGDRWTGAACSALICAAKFRRVNGPATLSLAGRAALGRPACCVRRRGKVRRIAAPCPRERKSRCLG
jgi:hypothetical protein